VLYEFGGPDCLVDAARGPTPLAGLLPEAFGPADLPDESVRPAGAD
jgi:cytidine deaminase